MKLFRRVLIGVAALIVLVAVVVGIAFTSGFQTWAARKALAAQPDIKGTIGSVSAGLQRIEVKDVRIEQAGVVLTLPAAQVDLPLVAAGMNQKISISRLVAKGWVLDLSHPVPAPAKTVSALPAAPRARDFSLLASAYAAGAPLPAAEVFRGVFAQLQLPVDLSVDGVELEGEVILAALAGKPPTRIKVTLRGGGLAAGREGTFAVNVAAVSSAGVAPVSALALQGTITAAMDSPRSFTRLSFKAEASASGTQFPGGVKLNADLAATRSAAGERYAVILSGGGKQLAALNVEFPVAAAGGAVAKLTGTWQLDLRDSDLTPFAMDLPLPAFQAAGAGAVETDAAFGEIHASGKLTATADKLGGFKPELEGIGSVRLVADFDLTQRGEAIRVTQLAADFSSGRPVASVRALQGFEFNTKTGELKVADPAQDLLGLALQGVPLGWAQPFLKGVVLSGGDLRGEFVASARNGGLTLRPKTPLTIANFSVEQTGKPLLRAVDLSLSASADYTPQGWQATISALTAASDGKTFLTVETKAGQLSSKDSAQPIKATGRVALDLPGALKQPAASGLAQLTGGDVSVDFAASLGTKQEIEAKLAVLNLAADTKPATGKLPAISAEIRADREADGKITLAIPLLVERAGRKSDLNITGTVVPEKTGFNVDAYLTSTLLVVDDVQILTTPFGAESSPPQAPAKTPGPTPDPAPPWAGINGKITLALKKIVYSDTYEVTNVAGTLRLDAGAVKFDGLRAVLGPEGELKADGGLTFDAKAKEPYALAAALTVSNFDTGPLFRAIDPAKTPTLEGRFNVNSKVTGTGQTIGELAERARGTFDVSSKGGVFRGLAAVVPSERLQAAQSTLAIVSGFLGGSTAKTVGVASEILKILSEIPFDQLSVTAERDPALNLVLKDFSLIAPDVRLGGAGRIVYTPGKRLLEQTLDMQFSLGTRGRLGDLMGEAKLLKPEKDNLGYTAFSAPIRIGGTLGKTDASDLQRKLVNLAVEKSGVGSALEKALEKFR